MKRMETEKMNQPTLISTPHYHVVLMFGPPLPEKESFLPKDLRASDAVTLSPDDIFESDPTLGLRDIALRVAEELKSTSQVVILGGFRSKSARTSLLHSIHRKQPGCRAVCVQVLPKYGLLQALWAHQFGSARSPQDSTRLDTHIKQWFDDNQLDLDAREVDVPMDGEGYDLMTVRAPLSARTHLKMELPALFLQWEGILDQTENIPEPMILSFQKWRGKTLRGRIIIICDGREVTKGTEEMPRIKRCVKHLSQQVECPVYVVRIPSRTNVCGFCVPPQPGVLAFLQLQHSLDLHNKFTACVFSTRDHMKMAETAGVRHIKVNSVVRSPNAILEGHTQMSSIHPMLHDLEMGKPSNDHEQSPPLIPLYNELCQNIGGGHAVARYSNGLEEHGFVKDLDTLQRYQANFVSHVTSINHSGSKLKSCVDATTELTQSSNNARRRLKSENCSGTIPKLRSWMIKKPKRDPTITDAPCLKKEGSSSRCLKTVYMMSAKELTEMAQRVLKEAGRDNKGESSDPG